MPAHAVTSTGWSSSVGRLLSPVGLGMLTSLVPPGLVDEALAVTERAEQRWRALPARLGVYFVLVLCLLPTTSYASVLRAMIGATGLVRLWEAGWTPPTSTALSKVRDRVGALPLEVVFRRLGGVRPSLVQPWSHAFGLLVCAWDGTEFGMADTAANRARFGRHRSRTGAVGGPKARLVVLLACGSRRVIDAAIGGLGKGEGEVSLAHRLIGSLHVGMLLLADRAFLNYSLWSAARAGGAHLLWRAKRDKPRLRVGRVLPDGSYLAHMIDPADARRWRKRVQNNRKRGHRPPRPRQLAGVTVRVVEAMITVIVDGETRTERYLLVTSLLDPQVAPAEQLVALYARRWVAETGIREIKTVLLAGRGLRGATPLRVRQELWAALIVYQAIRLLVCQAALTCELDPSRISFTAARDATRTALTTTPAATSRHLEWIYHDLRRQLITTHRSHRIFPRALKNTLSRYPYRGTSSPPTSTNVSYRTQVLTPAPEPGPIPTPRTPVQPRAA